MSWAWNSVANWFRHDSSRQIEHRLPADHVDRCYTADPISADRCYIRIWIVEMMLAKSRDWFKDLQPAVNSLVRLTYADQPAAEVVRVPAPSKERFHADRSILMNYPVLDLVPYRGGTLELEVALVEVKGDDQLGKLIDATSRFAALVSTPLSRAVATARDFKTITESLLGAQNEIRLGYHNMLGGGGGSNQLTQGYLVLLSAEGTALDANQLWVKNDHLCSGATLETARPVSGRDYMLLRVEALASRDDLAQLKEIKELRQRGIDAIVSRQQIDEGKTRFRDAIARALQHDDLITADRNLLADTLVEELGKLTARAQSLGSSIESDEAYVPPSWDDLVIALPPGTNHVPTTPDQLAAVRGLQFPPLGS